jgi:hypothetical protein
MCTFCGVKCHKESKCFKKNPTKAPEWWKEKNTKVEPALSNVEVALLSLDDPRKKGANVAALQTMNGDTLTIMCQENVGGEMRF